MRVIVVSNMYPDSKHPAYGTFVKKHCEQLERLGVDFDLAVMKKSDTKFSKIVAYISFYIGTIVKLVFNKYDIVYVHYASHSGIPVLVASFFKKMTVFVNVHGSDVIPENSKQSRLQGVTKQILANAEKIVVPSEYFRSVICTKYKIEKSKVAIYPSGGIDSSLFYKRDSKVISETKKKYGFENEKPSFAVVGRISEGKGWDMFLDAISLLAQKDIAANFIIVGNGPQYKQMEELISSHGLDRNIIKIDLLPHDQLANFYSSIDYLVFPTKRDGESLGLVALEAMACGTPVIASDFAGPHFYMKNGFNGQVFEVGNASELSGIIEDCVLGKFDRDYMSIGAQKTAEKYYEVNILDKMKDILGC